MVFCTRHGATRTEIMVFLPQYLRQSGGVYPPNHSFAVTPRVTAYIGMVQFRLRDFKQKNIRGDFLYTARRTRTKKEWCFCLNI